MLGIDWLVLCSVLEVERLVGFGFGYESGVILGGWVIGLLRWLTGFVFVYCLEEG